MTQLCCRENRRADKGLKVGLKKTGAGRVQLKVLGLITLSSSESIQGDLTLATEQLMAPWKHDLGTAN